VNRYKITVNNQEYTVEIEDPNASPVTVHVNGKPFQVKVSGSGGNVQGGTISRPAAAVELAEPYVPVVVPAFVEAAPQAVPEPAETTAKPAAAEKEVTAKQAVTAPMPGKILDIAVRAGDAVKQGDTLCNLEAMKMKSPIRATTDGAIAQVLVTEGQNVNYGDVLFTLA
jgi:biotin carboxyl carrier protein